MFDWDGAVWLIMGLIAILLFGAIIGSIVYVWMTAVPIIAKVIWTTCMAVLSLIVLALALVIE